MRWILPLLLTAAVNAQEWNPAARGCPAAEEAAARSSRIGADDWIELTRTGCVGSCPAYNVRLYGDGRVVWVGVDYVAVLGTVEVRIDASDVGKLFERAREGNFWSLCAEYDPAGSDLPSENIAIAVAGKIKTVAGNSGNQPQFLSDLASAIDAAADTHRWRHGDPKLERFLGCLDGFAGPCDHLADDAYVPKPGVSPLMRAAAQSDLGQVTALLQQGVNPNERDASGWTALMYAARAASPEVVRALLNAGADAKLASNAGEFAGDAVVGAGSREKLAELRDHPP